MKTVPLSELAVVIRSKNAGPYELTLDVLFKSEEVYRFLKSIGFFTRELMAELYGLPIERIFHIIYFDPAAAVKCTLQRPVVSGSPGDTDIYGAQQHAPLLDLKVPAREA
ncbi:MAG: DUF4387 domain-containing protein [Syntrophobacteraceae bacterium]|jgi:hypothetical protein|nr:DUF4387 domain-containing protein [Syntrophobacteraceae bacterium]